MGKVDASFDSIGQTEMLELDAKARAEDEAVASAARTTLEVVNTVMLQRMDKARVKIEALLEAGEVRELDAQMVRPTDSADPTSSRAPPLQSS